MCCQELRANWSDSEDHREIIPVGPLLCSFLLHGFVVLAFLFSCTAGAQYYAKGEGLKVRLLTENGKASLDSVVLGPSDGNSIDKNVANKPLSAGTPLVEMSGTENLFAGGDEGYLPPAFLSRAAVPVAEIDIQDIFSPEEGIFQMYLWIDSRGRVTRVDVQNSEVAGWVVDEVVDRFKKSRFSPGLRGDKPVAAIMHVEVVF